MPFTTGPIENVGNQPANANRARVKILNRTGGPLTGVVRSFRLDGTRTLIEQINFNVAANASNFVTLSLVHSTLGQALQYEVEIVPNQNGGIYSVYGVTAGGVIITAQRVLNSELTQIL
ncbi:ATPase [Bacillus sp. DX1.1]|uniref:ATPase n=1 Tax=unclassified Bacillus (in: firmicutes) TaxID=185979 RepID=UPI00256FD8D5|nr:MULTISPECIES: ATPase [unclassified Bacillus (in: firmicutes)]MDM5153397.1 ATPase [Bacillus sp. DX1.1]WJE82354.1 ATPase [Bacillus sp. DX3.1]